MQFTSFVFSFLIFLQVAIAQTDVEPITYKTEIWGEPAKSLTQNFKNYDWVAKENGFISKLSDLTFFNQKVDKVAVLGKSSIKGISIVIIGAESFKEIKADKLLILQTQWTNLLNKKLKSRGSRKPLISNKEAKITQISWTIKKSIVSLISKKSLANKPKQLSIIIHPLDSALPTEAYSTDFD